MKWLLISILTLCVRDKRKQSWKILFRVRGKKSPQGISCILWNQYLINLDFDDNKIRFELMIIFQVWLEKKIPKVTITKIKSTQTQRKINKKKKTSKRSVFQDLTIIGFLCKVVGALGFSCITFFIYAPKSSKSYFVLNLLKLDNIMFSNKTLFQMLYEFV